MHLPRIIAHRGASGYAPENTLAAMRKAKELGATWVEFDVQLSKDNAAIIFHDDDLDRTSNGHGLVIEKTLTELMQLDAGAWFSEEYTGTPIPTLPDLLTCLLQEDLHMNLEIKPFQGCEIDTVNVIFTTLQNMWPKDIAPPLLSSFNPDCLFSLQQLNSPYPIGLLMHEWNEDWLLLAKQLKNCISINVNQGILTEERVAQIKKAGYGLLSYTVNSPQRAQELYHWGVDGVFTDYIDKI